MPSLSPILSCATDFTDVGEGKVQGRNLHNNDSIQQQFNKSSFIELISLGWRCRVGYLNLKHFVCILVGKCHEWGNSPLVLPVEGLWVHTCSGAFLVNFHYHNDYYNDFKMPNGGFDYHAPKCMLTSNIFCACSCSLDPSLLTKHLFARFAIAPWRGNASMWLHRQPALPPALDGLI